MTLLAMLFHLPFSSRRFLLSPPVNCYTTWEAQDKKDGLYNERKKNTAKFQY
nr:MAG TPA: Calcipressin [Caudoviricetes sp.]